MGSNLSSHELNTGCYMQKMLYTNPIIITNKKPVIDMQKLKTKEYKYITKENQQTMREESKRTK